MLPGDLQTPVSSVWCSARSGLKPRALATGRFSASKMATCTNSCKKKTFENPLNCGYKLPATQTHPPPSSPSMFRIKSVHAFLQQERRHSGGVEKSACRRTWDVHCH